MTGTRQDWLLLDWIELDRESLLRGLDCASANKVKEDLFADVKAVRSMLETYDTLKDSIPSYGENGKKSSDGRDAIIELFVSGFSVKEIARISGRFEQSVSVTIRSFATILQREHHKQNRKSKTNVLGYLRYVYLVDVTSFNDVRDEYGITARNLRKYYKRYSGMDYFDEESDDTELIAEISKLYESGVKVTEIANRLNMKWRRVYYLLNKAKSIQD